MVVLCYLAQLTLTRWDYPGGPNLITGFLKSREFWILRWARNEECRKHQRLKPILCQPSRKWGPQTHSHRNWNLSTTWMILEVILSQHLQIRAKLDSIIFSFWERRCSSAFPDFWLEGLWYKRAVSSHFVCGGLLYRKRELCPWGFQQQPLSSVFPLWFYHSSMLLKQFLVSNSFC